MDNDKLIELLTEAGVEHPELLVERGGGMVSTNTLQWLFERGKDEGYDIGRRMGYADGLADRGRD